MSDAVWLAIIGFLTMIVKELLDQRRARLVADKVEKKAEEVKAETAAQNAVLSDIHEQSTKSVRLAEAATVATKPRQTYGGHGT